jgi:hypothetical protein
MHEKGFVRERVKDSDARKKIYTISTLGYLVVGLCAVWLMGYAASKNNYILLVAAMLIVYVAWDNFFCDYRKEKILS